MSYAVNAQLPVILASDNYYALDNGVWFVAASATGSVGGGDRSAGGDLHHPAQLAGLLRDVRQRLSSHG